jgi:hypothetical protein
MVPVENPQTRIWFKSYTDVASSGAPRDDCPAGIQRLIDRPVAYHMDLVTDDPPTFDPSDAERTASPRK